jgi:D-aminoacyl-tRNA deacylase
MKALLQRVSRAEVRVDGEVTGAIDQGLLVLLGCGEGDGDDEMEYLVEKLVNLRIFADDQGRMNLSLLDVGGEMLVVSQFTLYADTRKGRRPSFVKAMKPGPADELYRRFCQAVADRGVHVETGVFGAMMDVELVNDGPVTIMLDTAER